MQKSTLYVGLLAALAVCTIIMYATSDHADHAEEMVKFAMPPSAKSVDFVKAPLMFTATPNGAARLIDYFRSVERNILAEKRRRQVVMARIRAKIERNAKYAHKQRMKLRRQLNKKIARNARHAHEQLWKMMRKTQASFHSMARARNNRFAKNNRRINQLNRVIAANKRQARRNLHAAVVAQQRAMAAVGQSLNAKIRKTNKRVSANASQIRTNAKVARKALAKAVAQFNHKLSHARSEARKGRSKLAQQLATQTKKLRQWASSRVLGYVAQTAAKFKRVRHKMAQNRHLVDSLVQHMTGKFAKALQKHKATFSRHEKRTGRALAAYRAKTAAALKATKMQWKASVVHMTSVVKQQETKLLGRLSEVSGRAAKNKALQARVNRRFYAETRRVTKLGLKRERAQKHAQKNMGAAERRLKRHAWNKIHRARTRMNASLNKMHARLVKDRRAAARKLKAATGRLYKRLAANEKNQKKVNKNQAAATRAMQAASRKALNEAKAGFRAQLLGMAGHIARSERKMDKRMSKLTGVVRANAIKDRKGRAALASLQRSQRADLQNALHQAVESGKRRAAKLNKNMIRMNKATRSAVAMQLSSQITSLKRQNQHAIDQFRLSDKRALAAMRKGLMAELNQVKAEAARNTRNAARSVSNTLVARELAARRAMARNAKARAAMHARITRDRRNAMRKMGRAMAYQQKMLILVNLSNQKKIKKANRSITAVARQMSSRLKASEARFTRATGYLARKEARALSAGRAAIRRANGADAARSSRTLRWFAKQNRIQAARIQKRFQFFYGAMARERARQDQKLAGATNGFNAALAKAAALADVRFMKSVKNLNAAKRQARRQLQNAKAEFRSRLAGLVSYAKRSEQQIRGSIAVVTKQAGTNRRMQASVNRRVNKELANVINLSNTRNTAAKRARGAIRAIMNRDKALAAKMVAAQARKTRMDLNRLNRRIAMYSLEQRIALTRATAGLTRQLSKDKLAAARGRKKTILAAKASKMQQDAARSRSKRAFSTALNSLTNTVSAQARSHARSLGVLTGTVQRYAKADKAARGRIRRNMKIMRNDMNRKIVRAIQLGQIRMNNVARRAAKALKKSTSTLRAHLQSRIETMSDNVFNLIQGNQQKLADNYLSAKAYCVAARFKFRAYNRKARMNPLVSIGDWCLTAASLSKISPPKSPGIGMGMKTIPTLFSSKKIKVRGAVAKINGLVAEYMRTMKQVNARWGLGIGKYLLKKLEQAMLAKGILQVASSGRRSSVVFLNGRKLGLSNRLGDFRTLSVNMPVFSSTLKELTKRLAKTAIPAAVAKPVRVGPPEWDGK